MFEIGYEHNQPISHHKPDFRPSQGCNLEEEDDEYFAVGIKNGGKNLKEMPFIKKTSMHDKN